MEIADVKRKVTRNTEQNPSARVSLSHRDNLPTALSQQKEQCRKVKQQSRVASVEGPSSTHGWKNREDETLVPDL